MILVSEVISLDVSPRLLGAGVPNSKLAKQARVLFCSGSSPVFKGELKESFIRERGEFVALLSPLRLPGPGGLLRGGSR